MTKAHFRLTLDAPAQSLLRLLQIPEYAWQRERAAREHARVPDELAAVLSDSAPGISPEQAYEDLFGSGPPGWHMEPGNGTRVTIETTPDGASPVMVMRAIAIAAPEAFDGEMHYVAKEPDTMN